MTGWNNNVCASGCTFGSLAAEIRKSDLGVRYEVAAGFERWRDLLERALNAAPASRADDTSR